MNRFEEKREHKTDRDENEKHISLLLISKMKDHTKQAESQNELSDMYDQTSMLATESKINHISKVI